MENINSCKNCNCLQEDSEGEMGYTYYRYLYCDRFSNYTNLKSFPFKKEMDCFEMSFESAMYVDEEIKALYEQDIANKIFNWTDCTAFKRFKEKYQPK